MYNRVAYAVEHSVFVAEFFVYTCLCLLNSLIFHCANHIGGDGVLIRNIKVHRNTVGLKRTACGGYRYFGKLNGVSLFKRFFYLKSDLCDLVDILNLSVYHSSFEMRNGFGVGDVEYFVLHISQYADNGSCAYIKSKDDVALGFKRFFGCTCGTALSARCAF